MPSTTGSEPSNDGHFLQQVADDVRGIRDLLDTLTPPAPVPDPVPDAPVEVRGD